MKKGMFSMMNYYLPLAGMASMHCSANTDMEGKNLRIINGNVLTGDKSSLEGFAALSRWKDVFSDPTEKILISTVSCPMPGI